MGLRQQIDNSGFPLQLAVADRFPRNSQGWHTLYEEHHWSLGDEMGFIDLVIEDANRSWAMVLECKRVRDSAWIFLKDSRQRPRRRHAKLWVTSKRSDNKFANFDWADVPLDPECEESSYCVVPGQDAKARPMLVRVAATLVRSTEALAADEAKTISEQYSHLRIYQNVIVTTAELKVCEIDIENIDLSSGEIPEDTSFKDVPFVRFRKQLGSGVTNQSLATVANEVSTNIKNRESTVFVVNAKHFEDFVFQSELPDNLGQYVRAR